MEVQKFSLFSREEVLQFETLLDQYIASRGQFALKHISLVKIFDIVNKREDKNKIFSAILDLQINFSLLYLDLNSVGSTWNNFFSKGKLEGGSILDSEIKFFGKMDIHRFNSSYIFRYRALWDKIMGILILIKAPQEYEHFISSKSKKKSFRKIALQSKIVNEELLTSIEKLLTDFDNNFRTSEAHGTGALRKFSFVMEPIHKNPQIELMGYWNAINDFICQFGKILSR